MKKCGNPGISEAFSHIIHTNKDLKPHCIQNLLCPRRRENLFSMNDMKNLSLISKIALS